MVLKVFTVYDSKAEAYLKPFYASTLGTATRDFANICNDPEHPFCKHPEDFCLFELGSYDDASGKFENLVAPISRGLAIEFKNKN
nr:MAG: nonstructural protein [Microvirus sp.]